MKKTIAFILLAVALIVGITLIQISNKNLANKQIKDFNTTYEQYKNKKFYGVDVLSIINKAIDNNETYAIPKDENGLYQETENTVKVQIILLKKTQENGEEIIQEQTYPMETLEKAGLDNFIQSFNLTNFECTEIGYNVRGRVNLVVLKQLEI